jgi:hypothetical protein
VKSDDHEATGAGGRARLAPRPPGNPIDQRVMARNTQVVDSAFEESG